MTELNFATIETSKILLITSKTILSLCVSLFCTARHENLWQSTPFHPDLHDGWNVCVHVPVQSHSYS